MPGSPTASARSRRSVSSAGAAAPIPPAPRKRVVTARVIEKPPQHGEKPYAQLVRDAFDGPVLRLSQRMKLLEEADARKIRRGDALDLIAATQRELEAKYSVNRPARRLEVFLKQYAAFVACYIALALIWCGVLAMAADSATRARPTDSSRASEVNTARIYPPLDH